MRYLLSLVAATATLVFLASCAAPQDSATPEASAPSSGSGETRTLAPEEGEIHFSNLRMLTDGGENAEAYFSYSGKQLIFQSTSGDFACDQIFTMNTDGSERTLVSTGKGRTTCSYFFPNDEQILYASTHHHGEACPPVPDHSQGYVWPIYDTFDLFVANADGTQLRQLTDTPGYDAEATISPMGDKIVFTSTRDGDLDIYTMDLDGSHVQRLTDGYGYDGGPFFSPDGSKIVYRANHPTNEQEIADYKELLGKNLIRPGLLEIWVMDADGSNKTQVTELGMASFGPFFHPSGEKIIFSSNYPDNGREFNLWMVKLDGSDLEQITFAKGFDGFPMFSPDGKTFVFASNRHNSKPGETNIFITDWRD